MHSAQRAYIQAKAAFETAQAAAKADKPPWPVERGQQLSDEQMDERIEIEMEIEDRHEVWQKMDAMIEARRELFAWAKATTAREMAGHPQLDEALEVFDKAPKHPRILDKVIDASLRLRV